VVLAVASSKTVIRVCSSWVTAAKGVGLTELWVKV
jgi:hypothetical protein